MENKKLFMIFAISIIGIIAIYFVVSSLITNNIEKPKEAKVDYPIDEIYKISSREDKIKEEGFNTLPKNSPLLEDSVVIKYDKKFKNYPLRIEFSEGLPVESVVSSGITGNIVGSPVIENEAFQLFDKYKSVLGIDKANLKERNSFNVKNLDYVSFKQEYNGIPVYLSNIILVKSNGKWVLLNSYYFNDINVPTEPKINQKKSEDIAKSMLATTKSAEKSELVIYPKISDASIEYYLAYKIDFPVIKGNNGIIKDIDLTKPSIFVDAINGKVIDITDNIRTSVASGKIYGDIVPDYMAQPREVKNFSNEDVSAASYSTLTNSTGKYSFEIGSNTQISSALGGPYVKLMNNAQPFAKTVINIPPYVNDINWSFHDTSYKREESNVFYHTNRIHDFFTLGPEPFTINELDYQMQATVEVDGTCNAYATGTTINFYKPGGGCEALSLSSDVIYHEYTHNMVFNVAPTVSATYWGHTGNMNEGYADYYACSLNNNSCLSDYFFYDAYGFECLRNCENTKKYPQDYDDEPHYAAEIISGSIWDTRKVVGQQIADTLALTALSYDPSTFQELADNFLIADDAIYGDANLSNGSPHGGIICNSFYTNHGIYSDYCFNILPLIGIITTQDKVTGKFINITGSAGGKEFKNYTLYYGIGKNPDSWEKIISNNVSVKGILYPNFDVSLLDEGYNGFKIEVYGNNSFVSFEQEVYVDNIKVKSPLINDIYRLGDVIEIAAESVIDLDNYTVEWGIGESPSIWFSDGISLIKNSEKGVIATWNSSFADEKGFYSFKITINNLGRHSIVEEINQIYFDPTLKKGWPQHIDYYFYNDSKLHTSSEYYALIPKSNTPFNNSEKIKILTKNEFVKMTSMDISDSYYYWAGTLEPVVADLNNDAYKEIIVYRGGIPPELLVYSSNGSLLWKKGIGTQDIPGGNLHIPLVGDINNDNYPEIIVINPNYDSGPTGYSEVYALNYNGLVLWESNISIDFKPTLAMADLNLDGKKEIVIQGNDVWGEEKFNSEKMTVLSGNGSIISSWYLENSRLGASIFSSPAFGNFDNDSDLEIVVAKPADSSVIDNRGTIYVYNLNGSVVDGWPIYVDGYILSSPVVGDIDRNGQDEIVVGTLYDSKGGGVYAIYRNGSIMPGWPFKKGRNFLSTPALGDINNDGYLEMSLSSLGFETYLVLYNGSLMDGWPQYTAWNDYYSSIIGDINNDGKLDILTTAGGIYSCHGFNDGCGGVYAWNSNGSLIKDFPKVTEIDAQAPSTIDDVDNNGKLELIASSDWDEDKINMNGKARGSLYVWELDGNYNKDNLPWPTFHHDTMRTGLYNYNLDSRPQSKIVNNENYNLTGQLTMFLQKEKTNQGVACLNDSDCNDNDFCTLDSCSSFGTCSNTLQITSCSQYNSSSCDANSCGIYMGCFWDGTCNPAGEEVTGCRTIDNPGYYYMNQDIFQPEDISCIMILSSDVILNCKGHSITSSSTAEIAGIYSYLQNTTIENCNVTGLQNGWGIYLLSGASDSLILNNTLNKNNYGIQVEDSSNTQIISNTMQFNNIRGISIESGTGYSLIRNRVCNNSQQDINCSSPAQTFIGNRCGVNPGCGGTCASCYVNPNLNYTNFIVINKTVTVPAKGLLKLDKEWNPQLISITSSGNYRVYARFETSGKVIETSWPFKVSGEDF